MTRGTMAAPRQAQSRRMVRPLLAPSTERTRTCLDNKCYNTYIPSMPTTLLDELRQRTPFASLAEEAHLNLSRTEAVLQEGIERVLKPHGVSATQYNVLRILRGAGGKGLCRHEIRDRLLTRMPDVTRLLDRMEEAGLVTRERDAADRRLVTTRLTARGRKLVDALDGPVAEEHERQLGHLDDKQLRTLVRLLTLVRHPE